MRAMPRSSRSLVLALVVVVTVAMGVSFAPDAGAATASPFTWSSQDSGAYQRLESISAVDAGTAWAVGDGGTILHTTDGGAHWSAQNSGTSGSFQGVAAVDVRTAWAVTDIGTIHHTADGGENWKQQYSNPSSWLWGGVSAVNASIAWTAGTGGTILKTTDGGEHWNKQKSGTTHDFQGISAADANNAWAVTYQGDILHTTDGGVHWNKQNPGTSQELCGVTAVDANTAWVVGPSSTILYTKDGGYHWTSQNSGVPSGFVAVSAADARNAWAVGEWGIIVHTSDGGENWKKQDSGTAQYLFGITAVDAGTAWAVGDKGTILYGSSASIAGCSPSQVVQGQKNVNIKITGHYTHFKDGVSQATFSGSGITVNSTDVRDKTHATANITIAADAHQSWRHVNVVTQGVQAPQPLEYGLFVKRAHPLAPHLDHLKPTSGSVGTQVWIQGENLDGWTSVTFNGARARVYYYSDSYIVCWVPYDATTGPVVVQTPGGTSNGLQFTVQRPQVPTIIDASPNSVHQGDTGVDIDITGYCTHFQPGESQAIFSGTGITVNSTSVTDSAHATANITVGWDAPTGHRDVNVTTGSEHPTPLEKHFTVHAHGTTPPRLDSILPPEGTIGDQVTLSGGDFLATRCEDSLVSFHNGIAATDYISWEDNKIVCLVPAGATTGPVTVTTPNGTSGGKTFTVGSPLIKACSPTEVVQGHQVTLDILGEFTHFQQGKSVTTITGDGVSVGITAAPDATHASADVTVAADATPGIRDVDVITGSEHPAPLENAFTIHKAPSDPPVIGSTNPTRGPVGTKVSVVGARFGEARGSSYVSFGGVPCTNYVSWSDYDVVCHVPLGATPGDVKVHTPWGTSNGLHFTVDPYTFYFAEGTTRPGFEPYLTIQNPDAAAADVEITYMKGDGTTQRQELKVPATSRSTVNVADVLGVANDAEHDFSSRVRCTNGQVIVAERPMYFAYRGAWPGGSDVVGALTPEETFYFAEGSTRPGFEPYLTIQNPNASSADIKITYMKGDGTTVEQALTVPATSRATVAVTDELGSADDAAHDFSCRVETTDGMKIIAERPMYFAYQGAWPGGSDVVGALMPEETFFFAEGTTRPGFEPYLTIQNPGRTEAEVLITYMRGDGTTRGQTLTVPATSRATVVVADFLGWGNTTAYDFSAKVESTNNTHIIAERPMYFSYGATQGLSWTGGHDVVGALSPAGSYYFAEGTTRPGFQPYITIQNPGLAHAQVKITYMKGDGTTAEQDLTVPARSRSTVFVPDALGVGNSAAYDFSCKVECTNSQEIIAERPMYFSYHGVWTGGTDVVGFAP